MSHLFWIASYPKSGNTWVRLFLANWLRPGEVDPNDLAKVGMALKDTRKSAWVATLGRVPDDHDDQLAMFPHVQATIAASRSGTSFCKTHTAAVAYRGTPLINEEVTRGAVYIVRDPRSVACSMMRHYDWTEDKAVECLNSFSTSIRTPWGLHEYVSDWSTHVESWKWAPLLRYEDMWQRPKGEFSRLLAMVGEEHDEKRLTLALDDSDLWHLQQYELQNGFSEALNGKFFGKGGTRWMRELSKAAIKEIEGKHSAKMVQMGYHLWTSAVKASGSRLPAMTGASIPATPAP